MSQPQKVRARLVKGHYYFLLEHLSKIDSAIDELVAPFEPAINLLLNIPGVERRTAITVLSEIGTDMSQFSSSKRLCRWAGLTPCNNESADKKKSVRIAPGVYLKPALVEAAHCAVKSKTSPYYRIKFERIAKRRGKKRAVIAIARMILTAVYHMLSTDEIWNPRDLNLIDMPSKLKEQELQKTLRKAAKLLVAHGAVDSAAINIPVAF